MEKSDLTIRGFRVREQHIVGEKKAPGLPAPQGNSRDAFRRVGKIQKPYLLSAGLAPKSRRPFTAVRAARTFGILVAAAP